jgi:hypothetical protein
MQKITPTHQAGHQSLYRATITINSKYGSFSLSRKAKECLKVKHGSRFDIVENKGSFYIQPIETGAFIFSENKSKKGRLYATDKGIANLIRSTYKIKSESVMLAISEKPIIVVSELNCFQLNR